MKYVKKEKDNCRKCIHCSRLFEEKPSVYCDSKICNFENSGKVLLRKEERTYALVSEVPN